METKQKEHSGTGKRVGYAGLRFRGGKIQVKFVAGRHQMIAEGELIDSESIR